MSVGEAQLFGLLWGFKESFRSYVSRSPGSRVTLDAATGVSISGEYYFRPHPGLLNTFDLATGRGELHFRGQVHFVAHHGFLSLRIRDPWVCFSGTDGSLSARIGDGAESVILARLEPERPCREDLSLTWAQIASYLHPDAVGVFGGMYPAGHPLDVVRVRVPAAGIEKSDGLR